MSYHPQFIQLLNKYLQDEDRSASWLAKRLKVSSSTVNRWQNGQRRPNKPETIIRIADALGVHNQSKRQELLVAAGYGYQAPAAEPSDSQVAEVAESGRAGATFDDDKWESGRVGEREPPSMMISGRVGATFDDDKGESGRAVATSSGVSRSLSLGNRLRTLESLVGVEGYLTQLEQVLGSSEPPWLLSIEGIGGIGKTSLAKALVQRVMGDSAGAEYAGFCWVSAQQQLPSRGRIRLVNRNEGLVKPALTVKALLDELVRQLLGPSLLLGGTPHMRGALSSEDTLALLQNHLTLHPHLIVIDNLETLTDTLRLLPTLRYLAAPTKFLLTSRESLFGEPDVYCFSVPELSEQDGLQLIRQQAKRRNLPHLLECDLDVLKPLYKTVGGNPLALRLVVGQTYIHHISVILSDLAVPRGEKVMDLYTHIYRRAWDNLDEVTRQLFLVMPLVAEQGGSLDYIKHVSQLEPHLLHKSLHLLVSLNLIDVQRDLSAWRYTIHQLTRTFLQQQVTQSLSSSAESGMDVEALFQTYIRRSAEYIFAQAKQTATNLPPLMQEQALHTLSVAYETNSSVPAAIWPVVRELLLGIASKMEKAGHREEWMIYLERGIQQSQQLGNVEAQAELHFHLGVLYHHQAQFDEARHQFSFSATHFEQLGNLSHQARALNRLASVARRQQRFEEAFDLAHMALKLGREAKEEQGYSHLVLGAIAFDKREWQKAVDAYSTSLALWEKTVNPRLMAWGLGNLGKGLRKVGRYDEAITCYQKAINLFEAIQDPLYQAVARMNLGNVYLTLEQPLEALKLYLLAEATFDKTFARLSLAQVNFNKGQAYEKLERWDKAEEVYRASLAGWQQIGTISSVVNVMARLAGVYLAQKRADKAIETYQDALNKLTQIKNEPIHQHLFTLLSSNLEQARQQIQPMSRQFTV